MEFQEITMFYSRLPLLQIKKLIEKPWYLYWTILSCLIVCLHWSGVYYQHDGPKWWLLDTAFAVYVACKLGTNREFKLTPAGVTCGAFVIWCFLSCAWASNIYAGLEMGLRYCLLAVGLYFLILDMRHNGYRLLAISCVIASCAAFFITLFIERYILKLHFERANYTPLGFINHGGHVYIIWIPILFWGLFNFKLYGRVLCGALLLACLWLLADSAIRASIVGLAGACLAIGVISLRKDKPMTYRTLLLLATLILAIGATSLMQPHNTLINEKITLATQSTSLNQVSSDRILIYKNTLEMIFDSPLGVGMNNFEYIHPLYGKAGTPHASPFMNESEILRQPHNYYLKIISETGWLGGLLLCVILGFVGFGLLRCQITDNPWFNPYRIAIAATFINALFCATFINPASLWFFVLLMASFAATHPAPGTILQLKNRGGIGFSGLLLALFLLAFSSANFVSQHFALQGRIAQDSIKLQRALAIFPGNERAWFDLAMAQFEQDALPQDAIGSLNNFLKLSPYHIGARYKLSQWYCYAREFPRCKSSAEQLLRYYPTFKPAQQLYYQASQEITKNPR
jgi:O-Antigen ligase